MVVQMNRELLLAATTGDWRKMNSLYDADGTVLDGRTIKRNTCLHIAAQCGHEKFCSEVVGLQPSLLSATNSDNEIPILTAVKGNHADTLTQFLLDKYIENQLSEHLLTRDNKDRCNVLHHAIRSGHKNVALDLIDKSPDLSRAVNSNDESPIFMAVLRKDFKEVYLRLIGVLQGTGDNMYSGTNGSNALHAAVKYDEQDFVNELVRTGPDLFRRLAQTTDKKGDTPMQLAAHFNRFQILQEMLTVDQSFGYHVSEDDKGVPLLFTAAHRGHVEFARMLLQYCPDAPYACNDGRTCLHEAVIKNRMKFVEFILEKESKLWKLINMQDKNGDTALHLAVQECNTKMVTALLDHPHIDITVLNKDNCAAIWKLNELNHIVKTINWTKIYHLISDADVRAKIDIYNLHEEIRNKVEAASREDVKSLTAAHTANTSLVAILIATITFAAGFTLPGGYSSSAGSEGLAIMARKLAFQAFLIFDALAMFCSLAVAFLCIKTRSTDFEVLLYYRYYTKKLMLFAYMATALAFATGLYTVLAPRLLWLAITICVLSVLLPIMMVIMGEWPVWQIKIRRGKLLDSKFLDMV